MLWNYLDNKKIVLSVENYGSPRGPKRNKIKQKSKIVKKKQKKKKEDKLKLKNQHNVLKEKIRNKKKKLNFWKENWKHKKQIFFFFEK